MATSTVAAGGSSFLASRRGKLTLLLLCLVAFLDYVDASIVNVALPSIHDDLHVSVQNVQWVISGYLLTYGGFMLLGGRAADLLGRRRLLVAGTVVFALASLGAGLANESGVLVAARLVQGLGAAMMLPAALSLVTTSFSSGTDRTKALGAWGAMAGVASAAGVLLGGVLTQGPGWRWVFFVNPLACVGILAGTLLLIDRDRPRAGVARFDLLGALLSTAGMLLLVYGIVRAPIVGWGATSTVCCLIAAAIILAGFVVNERRVDRPLLPLSVFRIDGLAAADATQLIAIAGFLSTFFFLTLYMQDVLGYSPIRTGLSYLPVTGGVIVAAGVCSKLFPRTGTRPVLVIGALAAAGGVGYLSRLPLHGTYPTDLLPGLIVMSLGLGAVFVGATTAANAGVPADQAGLAAALINASQQLGGALGIAIFTAIATSHTNRLLATHIAQPSALASGFHRALIAAAVFLVAAALIAVRATNTRGEPTTLEPVPVAPLAA
ncbi:MAG TPA: MFS transporter [Mycobacteriales bacterium]|nr:MFS transporter [Mycobacteriales bacterium]